MVSDDERTKGILNGLPELSELIIIVLLRCCCPCCFFCCCFFKSGDLWNLKYLSKFRWSHLTEKVAYERRVREQKLRVEMMQARRENAAYVEMVETGKKLDKIEERKRKRGDGSGLVKSGVEDGKGKEKKQRNNKRLLTPMTDGFDKSAKLALLGGLV